MIKMKPEYQRGKGVQVHEDANKYQDAKELNELARTLNLRSYLEVRFQYVAVCCISIRVRGG